jgi:hypothetical protein
VSDWAAAEIVPDPAVEEPNEPDAPFESAS